MRTLVVLAMTLLAPAAALAQSNYQLYGRLNVGLDAYSARGAAAGSGFDYKTRPRLYDVVSRIGLRGSERLGDALEAVFQIETGINLDTGTNLGQGGTRNPMTGFFGSRDTFLGLRSRAATVPMQLVAGRISSYWVNYAHNDPGAAYINVTSPLVSYAQSGVLIGPVGRESNSLQLWVGARPFSGFGGLVLGYGHSDLSAGSVSALEQAQAGATPRDRFASVTVFANQGWLLRTLFGADFGRSIEWQLDHAQRRDVAGVAGRDYLGTKIALAWHIDADHALQEQRTGIGLVYQSLENRNVLGLGAANLLPLDCGLPDATPIAALGTTVGQLRRSGGGGAVRGCDTTRQRMWTLSAWHRLSARVQLIGQIARAADVSGSSAAAGLSDSGVRTFTLGARYVFSRRTWVYASYSQITNGRNNYVDFWGAGLSSANQLGTAPGLAATSAGADPRIIAVGLYHAF